MAVPLATRLGYLGVGKEATPGVPVAPTVWPPVPLARVWRDDLTQVGDTGYRGSTTKAPWDQYPGSLYARYQIPAAPGYPDSSLPLWTLGVLGDVTCLTARTTNADGTTTTGSLSLSSASAAFTSNDVGRPVSGTNIPAGAYLTVVTSATQATMSAGATGTGTTSTVTVGAASLVSHVGSLKNLAAAQPTSYTLTDFYGVTGNNSRRFAGCMVTSTIVKFDVGMLSVASDLTGFASVLVAQPVSNFTTIPAMQSWSASVTIGGTVTARLLSCELTFTRTLAGSSGALFTIDGDQAPSKVRVGGLEVTGKAVFAAVDDTEYLTYLNNTKPAVVFDFVHGTPGTGYLQSKFQLSRCNHTVVHADHSGPYMRWAATLRAEPNTSDAGATGGSSPAKVTFQNAANAGTFQ